MKEPRAMNCATLWEKTTCPSDEVRSKAFDWRLAPDEKIPMQDELFREVDHICQACEVYEPMYRHQRCAKSPLKRDECPEEVVNKAFTAQKRDLSKSTHRPDYEKVEAVCARCEVFEPLEGD